MFIEKFGLYSAFLLGVFHALEPGHGKTAMIGFLIGQRGSWIPAIVLGFSNALTHGALIFIIALLLRSGLSGLDLNDTEEGMHYFSQIAGVFIILLSFWLLYRDFKGDDCCEETPLSLSDLHKANTTWKQIRLSFLVGMSGGIVPCSTAVAMLVANISDGRFERGIYSVLIFSLGLFISVTLTTWLIVRSMSWVKFTKKPGFEKKLIWVRFSIIFLTGLFLIVH